VLERKRAKTKQVSWVGRGLAVAERPRRVCVALRVALAAVSATSQRHGSFRRANISTRTVSAELVTSAVFPGRVEPGITLGAYEVLLCIARGGMACVWAARQRAANGQSRIVALKTVLPELVEPEFESMFREEARVAARIRHPNVCEVVELVEQDGVLALAMEWVDGDTLNAVLGHREQMALDPRVAAFIVSQVASGLHAAHELTDEAGAPMQLVHRDVSPQNILISSAGRVKVADFGVAKGLGGSREHTEAGRIKGKLSYMSPEQAEGKPLDRRSDVYALGIVLYVATVGEHPFRAAGDSRDDQLLRLLVGQFDPPSAKLAGYPAELEAIVLRAMQREPEDRFATADEMRVRLGAWLAKSELFGGEQQVARVLRERLGAALDQRTERIQRCLVANHQLRGLDNLPSGASELSYMPTSRGVSHTLASLTAAPRARHAARGILTAIAAAALGVIGTLSFTGGDAEPERAKEALVPAASAPGSDGTSARASALSAPSPASSGTASSGTHGPGTPAPGANVQGSSAPAPAASTPLPTAARRDRGPTPSSATAGEDGDMSGMAAARRRARASTADDERPSAARAGHPPRLQESTQRHIGSALSGAASRRQGVSETPAASGTRP
jgi:serine/threonine protein kinase